MGYKIIIITLCSIIIILILVMLIIRIILFISEYSGERHYKLKKRQLKANQTELPMFESLEDIGKRLLFYVVLSILPFF